MWRGVACACGDGEREGEDATCTIASKRDIVGTDINNKKSSCCLEQAYSMNNHAACHATHTLRDTHVEQLHEHQCHSDENNGTGMS
eukprot:1155386-Pelagomonas_calceolata.AAC.2